MSEEQAVSEGSGESSPVKRLTYKQTHELVVYCSQVPEQVHETWVAMAEAATEKLGFKVTVYSLKMALEAAGRNTDSVLKLAVELPVTEAMYWSSVKSVESFGNSLVAMTNYIETLEARVEVLERKVKELQENVEAPMNLVFAPHCKTGWATVASDAVTATDSDARDGTE